MSFEITYRCTTFPTVIGFCCMNSLLLFAGYIFDITHSYDIGFFMTGGLVLFAMIGFCMLELPAIKRRENQDAS